MSRRRSIRTQLTAGFTAALAAAVTVAVGVWIVSEWSVQRAQANRLLRGIEYRVREELADSHPDLGEVAEDVEHSGDGVSLELVHPDGLRRALTRGPVPPPGSPGPDWIVREVPNAGETVRIGLLWAPASRALTREGLSLAALGLLGTALAGAGAWVLVGRTLGPIRKLAQYAESASAAEPNVELIAPSDDVEVLVLVQTLNGLLHRQAQAIAARSQFYATASHELRTPLQALAGHLELALSRRRTLPEYEGALREASLQTGRLVELTRDLLLLHQLESGQLSSGSSAKPAPVSLLAAEQRAVRLLGPIIEQRSIELAVVLPPELAAAAPPGQVDALVRNLLENAVRYAPRGATVQVTGGISEGYGFFRVANDREPGAPVEPATGADRHGLGLAICRAIVRHNDWQWEWSDDSAVRVTLRFPIG